MHQGEKKKVFVVSTEILVRTTCLRPRSHTSVLVCEISSARFGNAGEYLSISFQAKGKFAASRQALNEQLGLT